MSTRAWAAGAAAFLAVGGIVWLPYRSVGQTLVEQSAASGIGGDLASRAQASGVGTMQRARQRLAGAGERAAMANGIMADQAGPDRFAGGMRRGEVPQAPSPDAWVVPASALGDAKVRDKARGFVVQTRGRIESVESVKGGRAYRIVPSDAGLGAKDRIVVTVPAGEASLGGPGELASAFGKFREAVTSRRGATLFVLENGQIVSRIAPGPTGSAPADGKPAAAAADSAARSFGQPMGGWRLAGTITGSGAPTAIFAGRSGEIIFAQPGWRGDGLVVKSVRDGAAEVVAGGQAMTLAVW